MRMLMGLQKGLLSTVLFLFVGSCATAQDYETKEWPARNLHVPKMKNIQHIALANPDKVLMPPLHNQSRINEKISASYGQTPFEWL